MADAHHPFNLLLDCADRVDSCNSGGDEGLNIIWSKVYTSFLISYSILFSEMLIEPLEIIHNFENTDLVQPSYFTAKETVMKSLSEWHMHVNTRV